MQFELNEEECCALAYAFVRAPTEALLSWMEATPGLKNIVQILVGTKHLVFTLTDDIANAYRAFALADIERFETMGSVAPVAQFKCGHTTMQHQQILQQVVNRLPQVI